MRSIKLTVLLLLFAFNSVLGQSGSPNGLSIELGYSGGDGIFPTYIYGLQYTRNLTSRLVGYGKYNLSKGARGNTSFEEKYILEENTAEFPNSQFGQYVFWGVGLEFKIIKTPKSFLYLTSGIRYTMSKRSRSFRYSENSEVKIISSRNKQINGLGYELGIGYKRRFSGKYFVGGTLNFSKVEYRISSSFLIGIHF